MLQAADLTLTISQEEYDEQLPGLQTSLHTLGRQIYLKERPTIVVLEGWAAAGKGEVVRRLTQKLDPRGYSVYAVDLPTNEELNFHYQYRFWKQIPEAGRIAIFDGSWYRQLLTGCVELEQENSVCKRMYREINHFERQLTDFGAIISKFWIHVSPDEQLRRLEVRADEPVQNWKHSPEDLPPADQREAYESLVNEFILRTSTLGAPWTLVPGNCQRYTLIHILSTLAGQWSEALEFQPKQKKKKKKKK